MNNSFVVFCVHCKLPVGEMSMSDVALNCYEICHSCYEKYLKLLDFVRKLAHESAYEVFENLNEVNWHAFGLLKEIGELE